MATKTKTISVALNSIRNSNLVGVVDEARLQNLIEDYIYNEDESEDDDSSETDPEQPSTSSTQHIGRSASTPPSVSEDSEDSEDDVDIVQVEGSVPGYVEVINVEETEKELTKIRNKRCCKKGCIHQFTEDVILNKRLDIRELSEENKDFFVKGLLGAVAIATSETTLQKRLSRRKIRERPHQNYSIDGKCVCRDGFLFLLALGPERLTALKKGELLKPRSKPTLGGRQYNTRALTAEDTFAIVRFIEAFNEEHGLALPGRIPGYKRSNIKLLPSCYTKTRVYKLYVEKAREIDQRVVSLTTFKTVWHEYLPYIVVARPMTDLCHVCQTNNSLILRGANTSDPNKLQLLEAQKLHLHLVNVEREFYNTVVKKSKETAARMGITEFSQSHPSSREMSMGYCFDFAQQVHLPSSPMQPGPIYFMTPRKCGIFGVCCPAIPQQVNFLIDEGMSCGKGSNAVISYLHFFFEKFGLGETEAVLHCDNCSGQNKNKYVLWYLLWRVMHGYHRKISLNFMVPGHTKFAPDWCFGLLKQNFRRMEVHCLDDMCRAVTESAETLNKAQLVGLEDGNTVLVPSYDWQTFLSPYFLAFKGIKSLYHFKFEQGSPNVVARSSVGAETSVRLLKDDSNPPPLILPEPVPPPGLSSTRRKYLFDNIRQFVRDDCKDLLCPA